jgi:hypothetical protein
MQCPVCGQDCVKDARELIEMLPTIFQPCRDCRGRTLDKRKPLEDRTIVPPCSCGKRAIDDVFAHCYAILVEEGVLESTAPLIEVGTPLIHPGFAMVRPPYLPKDSLVLLSRSVTPAIAARLVAEIPEIRGVVKTNDYVPGLQDADLDGIPETYELLAGCDVRANVFTGQNAKVVIYKQQSVMHIEFPRGYDPKIIAVSSRVRHVKPKTFVDVCSGAGTLGIIAGQYGVPRVILNDAWYAAAFWSAYNLRVNRESLGFEEITCHFDYEEMKKHPVAREPVRIAETKGGSQYYEVYQGDCHLLHTVLPERVDLAVIDLFEKNVKEKMQREIEEWQKHVGGEVFIP